MDVSIDKKDIKVEIKNVQDVSIESNHIQDEISIEIGEIEAVAIDYEDGDSLKVSDGNVQISITKGDYPFYTGQTTFVPSTKRQTVQTSYKTLKTNIIIEPIPQNYGLITWNGSTLTVS